MGEPAAGLIELFAVRAETLAAAADNDPATVDLWLGFGEAFINIIRQFDNLLITKGIAEIRNNLDKIDEVFYIKGTKTRKENMSKVSMKLMVAFEANAAKNSGAPHGGFKEKSLSLPLLWLVRTFEAVALGFTLIAEKEMVPLKEVYEKTLGPHHNAVMRIAVESFFNYTISREEVSKKTSEMRLEMFKRASAAVTRAIGPIGANLEGRAGVLNL
jgi:hypothetical protein